MIEITGIDLVKFVQKVYDLSSSQGFGFLHFRPHPLSKFEALEIIKRGETFCGKWFLEMDYINGRACKMTAYIKDGKMYIGDSWYDHTDDQLNELLSTFKIECNSFSPHSKGCNCITCRIKSH
jgi:hypothetical protein